MTFNMLEGFPRTTMKCYAMSFLGRLIFVLIIITGIIVAVVRLRELQTPMLDVLVTGGLAALAIVALFGLLLGFGKLLGKLFR